MKHLSVATLEEEIKRVTVDRNWMLVEVYFNILGKKLEYDEQVRKLPSKVRE